MGVRKRLISLKTRIVASMLVYLTSKITVPLNEITESINDITDIKLAQIALNRRLEQQALMTTISQSFLTDADLGVIITDTLKMIGEFTGVAQARYPAFMKGIPLRTSSEYFPLLLKVPRNLSCMSRRTERLIMSTLRPCLSPGTPWMRSWRAGSTLSLMRLPYMI